MFNRRGFLPRTLAPLAVMLITLLSAPCGYSYSTTQIADAIYLAEGGERAKPYYYGIRSIPCESKSSCRKICENTIEKNRIRFKKYGYKKYKDFISFLASRYCPTEGRNLTKAERRINGNWEKNVTFYLAKNKKNVYEKSKDFNKSLKEFKRTSRRIIKENNK